MSGKNGDFNFKKIDEDNYCVNPKWIDLAELYKHACNELTLQQTKRDQVIYIYILLFSFLIPLLFSLNDITMQQKGLILSATTVIGVILSVIVVRYRIYKEAYWITCLTITQLRNLKEEAVTKENIHALFYHCMCKKWAKNIRTKKNGKKTFRYWHIFWSNLFSAESLHYVIISLLTSSVGGLSLFLITWNTPWLSTLLCISVSIVIFALLLHFYYRNLRRVYLVLVDDSNSSFNFTFSKAWFLHFYKG